MKAIDQIFEQHEVISISMRLAKMNLAELSRRSGVSSTSLSEITRGKRKANSVDLSRIANVLPGVRNAYFGEA